MIQYSLVPQKCRIEISKFCDALIPLLCKYGLKESLTPFLNEVERIGNDEVFDCHSAKDFGLTKRIENSFFRNLLGEVDANNILTKYTSLNSLMRICKDNEIGMTSLPGMNDSTECYYADSYLKRHGNESVFSEPDNIYWGLHTFITSFSGLNDDLTMWRLYGNDASGISLHFKFENNLPADFILSPVSYAKEDGSHPKLDLVGEMQNIIIDGRKLQFRNFYTWRHFFKPYHYNIENEIRLLYMKDKSDEHVAWITTGERIVTSLAKFTVKDKSTDTEGNIHPLYPLAFRGITLGPQFVESGLNVETIKIMLREKFGWLDSDINIKASDIDNYRN